MSSERLAVSNLLGKWSVAGVPHKGWSCCGEKDAIEEYGHLITCDMCERSEVRYVHTMYHPDYHEVLDCGCICAGHMSENLAQAQDRDRRLRSRVSRREKFGERKGWKISPKGVCYLSVEGFHIVIARKADESFQVGIKRIGAETHRWGRKRYTSLENAKTASFDALEYVKRKEG